jgi:hypothetical protein
MTLIFANNVKHLLNYAQLLTSSIYTATNVAYIAKTTRAQKVIFHVVPPQWSLE